MVHTTRVLEKARDLTNRKNGRRSLTEKDVHFKEHIPLVLNNFVKGGGTKDMGFACAKDLLSVVGCLQKYDMNQNMCSQEIARFNTCNAKMARDRAALKESRSNSKVPSGQYTKLTGNEMNTYFKQFPQSPRNGPRFIPPCS
ncbi:unnamed protein product [Lepeophtheirus salmonis]|uniref:(salmon louse) hypothetical protein n=2 Tax=Lepeophtheirus salmonis TaxID=72036 RepID=A0A7R8CU67_LEPSM|nr:uncharacterized protein LOC121116141 [Lepeophtheirus salmonis]XP_040582655.1 uncharacterized protein LOC121131206 [Lepeophtheirus salmonis]CAB4063857.1 unnamed protein product [Lepeophtheirus salmonis]CAF2930781.1 unnamed protein product [Lepeophtheirus salmonis]